MVSMDTMFYFKFSIIILVIHPIARLLILRKVHNDLKKETIHRPTYQNASIGLMFFEVSNVLLVVGFGVHMNNYITVLQQITGG